MVTLALSSLRWRAGRFAASIVNVFLGATILMAFASLIDTGTAAGVSPADRSTLTIMALVVGGCGLLIVVFGVAATLNLSVRQRDAEIALLKSVGATPAQLRRLIVGEAAAVAVLGAVPAIPAAVLAGRAVLAALAATDQVAGDVSYHFGAAALGIGLGDTVVAALAAALITAGRAASSTARQALTSAATGDARPGRKRIIAGLVFLFTGLNCAVLTATVLAHRGYLTQAIAGEAAGHTSIGLALLAPVFMRGSSALLGRVLCRLPGASGYLADANLRQRAGQAAGVLMPIVLFIGLAASSLYVQLIQRAAQRAAGAGRTADDRGVETLTFVIVGMIAVFAAIVLINLAVTAVIHRRREFGQQRLIGATGGQVLRVVALESAVTVVTGVVCGTAGAAAGIVPYGIALAHRPLPGAGPGVYLGVVATAAALTFAATLGAGRRAVRCPALDAVAVDT